MEIRTSRRAVSTYLETFILIGVVVGGSALVYATTIRFSAPVQNSSSITVSDVSIRQGSGVALEKMVISNTGTVSFTSFTITNVGSSSLAPYGLVVTNTVTGSASNALTTGLVGYWPTDESSGATTADASGNGNTGTLTNTPSRLSGASCEYTGCLGFASASSQYVSVPNAAELSPEAGSSGAMTISAWVYLTTQAASNYIVSKTSGSTYEYALGVSSGGVPTLNVWTGGTTSVCTATGAAIGTGVWAHIVGTFSKSTAQCLVYVNGAQGIAAAVSGTVALPAIPPNVLIGSRQDGAGNNYFNGRVDDARIYNRALLSSEVSTLYSSTNPPGANAASVTASVTVGAGQSVTVTVVVYGNSFATLIGTSQSIVVSTSAAAYQQVSSVVVGA